MDKPIFCINIYNISFSNSSYYEGPKIELNAELKITGTEYAIIYWYQVGDLIFNVQNLPFKETVQKNFKSRSEIVEYYIKKNLGEKKKIDDFIFRIRKKIKIKKQKWFYMKLLKSAIFIEDEINKWIRMNGISYLDKNKKGILTKRIVELAIAKNYEKYKTVPNEQIQNIFKILKEENLTSSKTTEKTIRKILQRHDYAKSIKY